MLGSMRGRLITAESVSTGHPDSYMDYVVNRSLDTILKEDPKARFACDGVAKNDVVYLGGEITTSVKSLDKLLKQTVAIATEEIGYDWEPKVKLEIAAQSPDIAMGTNDAMDTELGASDQGTQTGYACNETDEYYPLVKTLADGIIYNLFSAYKSGEFKNVKADMKSQVTVDYSGDKPVAKTVVVACPTTEDCDQGEFQRFITRECVRVIEKYGVDASNVRFIINGTGKFTIYGPMGDSGEVGRKIVVDAYGLHPHATVGGGTFNGKGTGHVDRIGAYGCRYVAKNIVAAGLADECRIDVAYCIGVAEPMSLYFDFYGTEKVLAERIVEKAKELFSFKPYNLREKFSITDYATAGLVGHFGHTTKRRLFDGEEISIPWEQLDLVEGFKVLLDEFNKLMEEV